MKYKQAMNPANVRRQELIDKIGTMKVVDVRTSLLAIALLLDGEDWGGDQLEAIGHVFENVGIVFLSPDERIEDEDEGGAS